MSASLNAAPSDAMGAMSFVDSGIPDWGDIVDSDDEHELEESAEPIERYFFSGLYYPICIGQVLDQRYRIEHKFGLGGFSTVWMAHGIRMEGDVALKIMIYGGTGDYELSMQNEIIRTVQGTSNLLTYEDTFSLRGYMGIHRVLVFPLRGPSLGSHLK